MAKNIQQEERNFGKGSGYRGLSHRKLINKLSELAISFDYYYRQQDYWRAWNCYRTLITVCSFMELTDEEHKEVYAGWNEEKIMKAEEKVIFAMTEKEIRMKQMFETKELSEQLKKDRKKLTG